MEELNYILNQSLELSATVRNSHSTPRLNCQHSPCLPCKHQSTGHASSFTHSPGQ